ncbi:hypothetical protein RB195_001409 [Necator americanus]|uniref:Uncharacterized protein n=1 Tax=Necator americanus TaxID=51031 RepID=A0ABR1DE60_NECAM
MRDERYEVVRDNSGSTACTIMWGYRGGVVPCLARPVGSSEHHATKVQKQQKLYDLKQEREQIGEPRRRRRSYVCNQ